MGRLVYDSKFEVDFEDRLLAHLQIVIGAKLAKNESFYLSWRDTQDVGDGRSTIWIHPAIPLRFKYYGGRPPAINPDWVRQLLAGSHTPHGLIISDEPLQGAAPTEADPK
ncbi:ATP-dependent DNA ligase [Microbacteriaceae bacterium VKM Ac-2855]|nr:ATP-dependent DNA ligase [Microbacteriaceae bacterium VKM Ac-2855]